jgi:hypothetical protein
MIKVIEEKGLIVTNFEEKWKQEGKISVGYLSSAAKSNRNIGIKLIEYFLEEFPDTDVVWLLTGKRLSINTDENHTPMPKPNDSNGNPTPQEVWSQVEKSEKYTVVPTIILDKYEILSNREIQSRENTLQEVRATMKIAIAAKDEVITSLKRENAGLREQLKSMTPPQ